MLESSDFTGLRVQRGVDYAPFSFLSGSIRERKTFLLWSVTSLAACSVDKWDGEILEAKKISSLTASTLSPSIYHKVMGHYIHCIASYYITLHSKGELRQQMESEWLITAFQIGRLFWIMCMNPAFWQGSSGVRDGSSKGGQSHLCGEDSVCYCWLWRCKKGTRRV